MEDGRMAKLDPEIADELPWADAIMPYDEGHLVTYLRLLDAEVEGADEREGARIILHRDPDPEPDCARRRWEAHLKRRRWLKAWARKSLPLPSECVRIGIGGPMPRSSTTRIAHVRP